MSYNKAEIPADPGFPQNKSLDEQHDELVKEGILQPETPDDGIPDKFKGEDGNVDVQKLLKSYKELEKMKGRQSTEDADDDAQDYHDEDPRRRTDPNGSEVTEEERKAAEEATKKAGLDLQSVSQEWWDNGGLSDNTYDALSKAGFPKEMVDTYIEGLVARNSSTELAAYDAVGGQEAYSEMIEWAAGSLSPAEIEAYDAIVNSGSKSQVVMAVKGLQARYASTKSNEPREQITPKGGTSKSDVYESYAEMERDMNDPRYGSDPAYTRRVEAKAMRSNPV